MEYPICQKCGAAIGEGKLHERWHADLDRQLQGIVDKVMRELDRQVRMARPDRPH